MKPLDCEVLRRAGADQDFANVYTRYIEFCTDGNQEIIKSDCFSVYQIIKFEDFEDLDELDLNNWGVPVLALKSDNTPLLTMSLKPRTTCSSPALTHADIGPGQCLGTINVRVGKGGTQPFRSNSVTARTGAHKKAVELSISK